MPSSGRKRVLIGVMSSKLYLPTRGKAIQSSWMNEIDYRLADVKFFADFTEGYSTVQVNLQSKSCRMRLTQFFSSQKWMTANIRHNESLFQCLHITTIIKLKITIGSWEWTMTRFYNGTIWTSFWNGVIFFVGLRSMKSLLSYCFYVTMVLKMVLVSFFIRDYYDRSVNKYARSDLRYIVPSTEQ